MAHQCYHHIISNYTKFIHLTFNIKHRVCHKTFCSILKSFFNAPFCIKTSASEFYSVPKPGTAISAIFNTLWVLTDFLAQQLKQAKV